MKVSGWYESEYGASFFDYERATLKAIAVDMLDDFHSDCVGVDVDANDEHGNDVSSKLMTLLMLLDNNTIKGDD